MATWYEDPTRQTYTTTYENDQDFNREIVAASDYGWLPERADRIGKRRQKQKDGFSGSAWQVTWVRQNAT